MKFTPSGLFSELKGKLGNAVASSNATSTFFREHVVPKNTFSVSKQAYKMRWLSCVNAWRLSTTAVKSAYALKALTYNWVNSNGNNYHPSAYQLYMFLNMNIYPESSAFITSPQNYALLSDPGVAIADYYYGDYWMLASGWAKNNANEFLKVFVDAPYYQSSMKTNIPYGFLLKINQNTSNVDMRTAMIAWLGYDLPTGLLIFVKTLKVNKLTGLIATPQTETVVTTTM